MLLKRILVNLCFAIIIGFALWGANNTAFFERIELSLYNARFENFRGLRPPSKDILVLAVDEASVAPEEMGAFPWKRGVYIEVVNKMLKYGAKIVAFDIMFAAPSQFPEADKAFASMLKAHKDKIVLVSKFDFGSSARISGSGVQTQEEEDTPIEAASYTVPTDEFVEHASFGFANFAEDLDGQIRKGSIVRDLKQDDMMPTPMSIQERYEPAFTMQILRQLYPDKAKALFEKYQDRELWINFAGGERTYKTVSYYLVHQLNYKMSKDDFTKIVGSRPEDLFRDKIVLIGASAAALQDNKTTPFASQANQNRMPGVEVHANMLDTLMQDIPYFPVKPWVNTVLIFGFAILAAIVLSFFKPLGGLAFSLGLGALYIVTNIYFFHLQRLFLDLFAPLVVLAAFYTTTYAYRFLIEEREKRRVQRFFKSYVSPKLVEELLKNPDTMPSLKSERKVVTMLFSDIAGFTSMSEQMPPDEVEHILNEYLTAMSQIVFDNDGTLDKYIGDAVMAVWGNVGPSNPKTDAYKAVNTAIQMQKTLADLRQKWLKEGMVPLQIRIGVNTGEALVGNFGSPQKMDYTVIGDAVNTAARLEGLNKDYNTSILISQSTYDLVGDRLNARPCGAAKVKGKEESVTVYEPLAWKDDSAATTEVRDTKWIKGTTETQWK